MRSDPDATAVLQEAKQALEQALQRGHDLQQEIDDRIAQAAHNIKNPLSAMIGVASLVLHKNASDIPSAELDKHTQIIHRGCERSLEICDSLLTKDRTITGPEPKSPCDSQKAISRNVEVAPNRREI